MYILHEGSHNFKIVLGGLTATYICLLFSGFSNVSHFTGTVCNPIVLKLGWIAYFDVLFYAMGSICFVNKHFIYAN